MSIQNSHQISDVKILLKQGATGASIVSITKTGTSGLVDTYTVATSDGGRYTFEVTNGSDIQSIEKTSSHGMVDTYTVTLTNGNTTTFEVTNGDNWIDNSEKTATDAFQTITGGLLKMCKVALSPVQSGSGDPSPSNVRPITGHTQVKVERYGKNLLSFPRSPSVTTNGVTFTVNSDGTITVNGTATATATFLVQWGDPLSPMIGKSIILNGCPAVTGMRLQWYNSDGQGGVKVDGGSGTGAFIPATLTNANIAILVIGGYTINNQIVKPMVRLASDSDSSYEPYMGETYTVEIPAETGTVYGGTLDLVSGELVIDRATITYDGSSDEAWSKYGQGSSANFSMQITIPNGNEYLYVTSDLLCNRLKSILTSATWGDYDDWISLFASRINTGIQSITTVDAWRAWLSTNPIDVCYKLASPVVVQLTPTQVETLIGDNNLLCPLAGQAMVEDGVKYFYIYTYHDLMEGLQNIADALEDDVTEITNNAVEEVSEMAGVWTTPATAEEADTSITISDASITTSSIIEVYCQNTSGNPVSVTNMTVTTGQAVLSFYALAEDTTFKLHVLN